MNYFSRRKPTGPSPPKRGKKKQYRQRQSNCIIRSNVYPGKTHLRLKQTIVFSPILILTCQQSTATYTSKEDRRTRSTPCFYYFLFYCYNYYYFFFPSYAFVVLISPRRRRRDRLSAQNKNVVRDIFRRRVHKTVFFLFEYGYTQCVHTRTGTRVVFKVSLFS